MTTTVIEIVTYRLKNNINKSLLNNSHEQINTFVKQQPGFLYRSISEDAAGVLHDIVYWQDMASATQASSAFEQSDACKYLISLTDADSVTIKHMPVLSEAMMCESSPA
ncbi:hypothetical protein GCM10009111_28850 [Colwellia asteriadis]|uniref:ABM domain-containing protein n=1 Tax=Colwellia asteriadis TaxID=517723 RepID=A0ABN1L9T9_9GAMM